VTDVNNYMLLLKRKKIVFISSLSSLTQTNKQTK